MKRSFATLLLPGFLLACQQPQPPAAAPPPAPAPVAEQPQTDRFVSIRRATCDTLLALSPEDRSVAAMFYIGYESKRYRAVTVNVSLIPSIEGLAVDLCAAEPNRTVADVFAEAYAETRRW
jgi:HdeA/HdeB family